MVSIPQSPVMNWYHQGKSRILCNICNMVRRRFAVPSGLIISINRKYWRKEKEHTPPRNQKLPVSECKLPDLRHKVPT